MSRFARPDSTTLTLANGDTLIVKRRLNAMESRRLRGMQETPTLADAGLVMTYLADWSLCDDAGAPVPIADVSWSDLADRIDALTEDDFDEIHAAIVIHVAAMKAERDAQKKIPPGGRPSSPTSPLPFAPDSASTKSGRSTKTTTKP